MTLFGYEICWDQHGEGRPQRDNQHDGRVEQMVRYIFSFIGHNDGASISTSMPDPVVSGMTNREDVEKVHKLMKDANVLLYLRCEN